ncbi:RNA-directed DNA polymerase, eukaryota [Tanacetum coccineum]|uniref:RNA-directed DNA polymerase, eukaryota n=1 Tax=Tanacetum coccineum TaxID=301880 RepID=A0ABQ4WTD5_9ASTR
MLVHLFLKRVIILVYCKRKKEEALIFKVDFAKAYDSVRWDYLLDVLHAFGFGPNWCKWIRGIFSSAMASILINGSPSSEFPFFCGLKQGDPLAPYLFILIMESLHISFSRVHSDGFSKGSIFKLAMLVPRCRGVFCKTPFQYLGKSGLVWSWNSDVRKFAWEILSQKLHSRLSKWKFFNGADLSERNNYFGDVDIGIKVLASKKNGGLGVVQFPCAQ